MYLEMKHVAYFLVTLSEVVDGRGGGDNGGDLSIKGILIRG